jgi:hypothetical protein
MPLQCQHALAMSTCPCNVNILHEMLLTQPLPHTQPCLLETDTSVKLVDLGPHSMSCREKLTIHNHMKRHDPAHSLLLTAGRKRVVHSLTLPCSLTEPTVS